MAPPITWHGTTTPSTFTWTTRSSASSGTSSNGPTSDGGRVGRGVDCGGVDEEVRDAPVDLDERERRLDRPAIGDVAAVDADLALLEPGAERRGGGARLGLEVEDRDPHPTTGERDRELGAELAYPAGDDGGATGEVEERVAHGAILDG